MVEFGKVRTFVGVDAHSGHCNLKAISRPRQDLLEVEVPTSTEALRKAVSDLPSPVWVMVEAGTICGLLLGSPRPCLARAFARHALRRCDSTRDHSC